MCDSGGPTLPRLRDGNGLAEGGRGLQVVDALAARWGSFRAARAQVVWCDLGQPLPATDGGGLGLAERCAGRSRPRHRAGRSSRGGRELARSSRGRSRSAQAPMPGGARTQLPGRRRG